MRVYVFGAGASQGSQPPRLTSEQVAPLMSELFSDAYKRFASEVTLSPADMRELGAEIAGAPIEEWLTEEWARVEGYGPQRRQAGRTRFARLAFYIWRLFINVSTSFNPEATENLYHTLLKQIVRRGEDFGLISFNYDTLLDQAVQIVLGNDLTTLASYQTASLVKPHGSVNWVVVRRNDDPAIPYRGAERGPDYRARFIVAAGQMFAGKAVDNVDAIRIIPPVHQQLRDYTGVFNWVGDYFYPLILLPLTTKSHAVVPWLADRMIQQAQTLLKNADNVYIIGYRARDDIFAAMVSVIKHGTRLHVVGRGPSAREVADRIAAQNRSFTDLQIHEEGFRDFVAGGSA